VSADPASATGFQPVTGTFQGNTHLGLQLLSNNAGQTAIGHEALTAETVPTILPAAATRAANGAFQKSPKTR
jgi:hypothetical protein